MDAGQECWWELPHFPSSPAAVPRDQSVMVRMLQAARPPGTRVVEWVQDASPSTARAGCWCWRDGKAPVPV